ncbi:TAXI family TRAP transporter solute-binding subunit [Salinisphaera hydrothermalis]|uniref:TAXI family TRAP transporter solute-binding subunit n=1 Tax=Salinisphaera hydrothermalis TaxID=563188 RepID=UPI003342D05D
MKKRVLLAGALLAATASLATASERIGIGTGGAGGVFYAVGAGMANVINNDMPGASATAQVTGASIENVHRVEAGQIQFGFSSASTLYQAAHGKGPFPSKQDVAAVAYLYPATLQIAVKDSAHIKSMADLGKARIGIGPPGSNAALFCSRLLKAYGVFHQDRVQFLSYSEATNAMQDNNLDASCILAGTPASAFIRLFTTENVHLLGVGPAKAKSLIKKYPYYKTIKIPAKTYKGQNQAVLAVGDPAILFTRKSANQKMVYNVTKTLFTHLDQWKQSHPMARFINAKDATHTPIPLAPGAKRYFDEADGNSK